MNALEIQTLACGAYGWFQQALIRLCVCAAVALFAVLVLRTQTVRDAAARIAALWREATHFTRLAVLTLLSVCVIDAGIKTNSPPLGMMMPILPPLPQSVVQQITEQEIAQGWRLVAETNCDADIYAMPDGITPSFNWHKRGTFGEWARLDLGDFAFPLGTNGGAVTSFSVFNDGRIRPTPRDAAREICAIGVPMLAMQGASRFWTADGTSGSKLLTWENFFLNADTNAPVNAQIELFQNGDFTTRSNVLERIYRRVEPFDWDGDGLENTVDPEPLVAGPDAHGTNAEWYNVVCSNVLEAVEGDGSAGTPLPTLSSLEGVNSNAYYFVDVVMTNGLAPIYFTGDRESRLGNPVVVARAFETNHVPLLIGINYAVTSPVPFSVSLPDDGFASVMTNSVSDYEVRWPLDFVFTESIGESNRVYTATVEPSDPGGVFTNEPPLRGALCGCVSFSGNTIVFGCSPTCDCGGICKKGILYYLLGGATFAATGGVCRCGFDDPRPPDPISYEPTNAPSLSIAFSKPAVIFENAYIDSEYGARPKRSTRTLLTVSAYGGTHGGSLSLSSQNLGYLSAVAGGAINLPAVTNIAPYESFFSTCVYEAAVKSDNDGDISVSGYFIENDTGTRIDSSNTLTSVQLLVSPERPFPSGYPNRHTFGVCERMSVNAFPNVLNGASWETTGEVLEMSANRNTKTFQFLLDEGACTMTVTFNGSRYTVHTMCLRPNDIVSLSVPTILPGNVGVGNAGGVGMEMELTLMPDSVCFADLRAMERVTNDVGVPSGYFSLEYFRPWWSHGKVQGAGTPLQILQGNLFTDIAAMDDPCPQLTSGGWAVGSIVWTIPTAWREPRDFSYSKGWLDFTTKTQVFAIDAAGTVRVEKFNCSVERDIQGHTNTSVNLPEGR